MQKPYHFESFDPPRLTERELRRQLEVKKLRRQLLILRIASLLSCVAMVLLGILLLPASRLLSAAIIGIAVLSFLSAAAVLTVFYMRGGSLLSPAGERGV